MNGAAKIQADPKLTPVMRKDVRLSNAEYHARDEINKSRLDAIAKYPAYYKAEYIDKVITRTQTPAMLIGSAYHKLQTEPQNFHDDFAVAPKINKRTKAGKEAWAEFEKQAAGKDLIDEEDYAVIENMVSSVLDHPAAGKLMGLKGVAESTRIWKDDATGLQCKCRPDWLCKDAKIIVDLKTTEDARPEAFSRSIHKYRYHVQSGFYLMGCEEIEQFIFIAVEKKPPYSVVCYTASPMMISAGQRAARTNLDTLKTCIESNRWPGIADTIQPLELPRYNND
tara:strand:- start:644 stop:1486 length:843 start_codon:yes stop_codon:yes gene_type:complete